jgi:hypothetical protein
MNRRRAVLGLAAIVATIIGLNVVGILRYPGGPLREPSADGPLWLDIRPANQGTNQVGITSAANLQPQTTIYTGIHLRNVWPWPARVERLRLVSASQGLELQEARLALPGTSGPLVGVATGESAHDDEELRLDSDYGPLPADLVGNSEVQDGRMWLSVIAPPPGEYSFEAVGIDYRVGPFTFATTLHQALVVCVVPLPSGTSCSVDSPRD